ncbi:MAG: ATP-binding protein [Desulfurivibrionaceae bacterium]
MGAWLRQLGEAMKFSLSFKFIVGCSLTLLATLGATFYVFNERQEQLIIRQAENEARAVFRQIVLMRRWIADHGGVFVERLPRSQPSPFLTDPEILDREGRHYTKETPAMVTKELSKYSREEGLFWFHITSLKLTNPENAPDPFERKALLAFEQENLREFTAIETIDRQPYLRYISPLYVEEACLKCHLAQGYKVGDVRGAISVALPMDKTLTEAARNRRRMFASMLLVVGALSGAMIYMMRHLVLAPMKQLTTAMQAFSQDNYQAAPILKTGDEFEDLSRSFAEMAARLTGYHDDLQNRIQEATSDLAETNQKLLETNRLLSAASERKSDFVARASHELRTPLTSIKGSMEYVTARLADLAPQEIGTCPLDELRDFLQLINKNTNRLIRMVNTMLDIERIEMGITTALHTTRLDLVPVIRETVTGLACLAEEKGVQITSLLPETLVLRADEDKIRQVLTNLLANAVKFTPNQSTVTLRAFLEEEFVVVEVLDQGPGIAKAEREKVFDKFYKLGNKEGSGLGLAICRSIIAAHGGVIGVADSPGPGACLYFWLPAGEK